MIDSFELQQQLKDYKKITKNIISSIENEEIDKIEKLFSQREEVIKSINELEYTQKEFINTAIELNLNELEEILREAYKNKKNYFYQEMQDNKKKMNASKNYTKNSSRKINFLDQKI